MTRHRNFLYGTTFLAGLVGMVFLTVAAYNGDFRDRAPVTLKTTRAGLTMDTGAPVKLRGVEVGKVTEVRPDGEGAVIRLELDPAQLAHIPADVEARIVPPTAFGAKYVELVTRDRIGVGPAIRAGAVIEGDDVTVEVDQTFAQLTRVLNVAKPAEVNSALTALATTLDQRGEQIGQLVAKVDTYLKALNPSLPTLTTDLRRAESVLDTYDTAMPALLDTLEDVTATSRTISEQEASLQALLLSLRSFSNETDRLVATNRRNAIAMLRSLAPVADVLAKYSPELPCVIQGVVVQSHGTERVIGGTNPGVTTRTRLQPADDPYRYPYDLPEIGDTRGPNCFGLPAVTATTIREAPPFDTGADPYANGEPSFRDNLTQTFFGNLAGLLNATESKP